MKKLLPITEKLRELNNPLVNAMLDQIQDGDIRETEGLALLVAQLVDQAQLFEDGHLLHQLTLRVGGQI